jgi:hypothetical protein
MLRKRSSLSLQIAVAGVLLFLAACSCPPGHDPTEVRYPIVDGSYTQKSYSEMGQGTVSLPSAMVRNKTLRVDRSAGQIRITYVRDGKEVVETWRLSNVYLD